MDQETVEWDRGIRTKQEGRLRADIDELAKRIADGRLVKVAKINQAIGRLKERYLRVARYYKLSYNEPNGTLSAEHRHIEGWATVKGRLLPRASLRRRL